MRSGHAMVFIIIISHLATIGTVFGVSYSYEHLLILASRLDLLKFVKKEVKKQQQLFLKRERNYQIEKLIPSVHIYLFLKK